MQHLATWGVSLFPWIIGFSGGVWLGYKLRLHPSIQLVLAASLGLLGNLFWAYLLMWATWLGFSLLTSAGVLTLTAATVVSVGIGILAMARSTNPRHWDCRIAPISALLSACLLAYLAMAIFSLTWVPAVGWDVLWSWAEISVSFLNATNADTIQPWSFIGTHPPTVAILGAWAAWVNHYFGGGSVIYAPWLATWLSMLLACVAYTFRNSNNFMFALLAGCILASVPLIYDHVVLAGYAELFLAASVLCAVALLTEGLRTKSHSLLVIGFIVALSCAAYKNIGFIYAACVVFGMLIPIVLHRLTMGDLARLTFALSLLVGVAIYLLPTDAAIKVNIGSRNLILQFGNIANILQNEYYSLIINQSFGVTAWLLVLPLLCLSKQHRSLAVSADWIPWCTSLLILAFLVTSQLSDYGFAFATPGSDTGNSRFTIIAIACAILTLPQLVSLTNRSAIQSGSNNIEGGKLNDKSGA